MLSVLFVSSNQSLVDVVTPILERAGHRFKHVFDLKTAFNWLSLSRYDVLLVDQDFENGCDLDYVANTARDMTIRTAISNSFGFGGTNGTLVFKRI